MRTRLVLGARRDDEHVKLAVSTMPDVIHVGLRPGHPALKDRRVR